ncbi:MAG: GxxExxY protein [Desulfuromonas sp.]|nr:MAG: GxxExxY protein [Desulfuromonas sp.]
MDENQISREVVSSAIEVHRGLGGPGLLEDVYEEALAHELQLRGLNLKRQVFVPVFYKGKEIKKPLILDLLVNDSVIIEVKAVEKHNPVYESQLLTYLRLSGLNLGLLVNFGQRYVKDGIHRVVNGLSDS